MHWYPPICTFTHISPSCPSSWTKRSAKVFEKGEDSEHLGFAGRLVASTQHSVKVAIEMIDE